MKKGMPVSANSPLVKCGPKWQVLQLPLPMKIFRPRCAFSG
jgi:hypothetical protein